MTMPRTILALALLLVCVLAPASRGAVDPAAARRFGEANELFRGAIELRGEDPTAARGRFEQAAAAYQALIDQFAIDNHLLHTNAGNAWLFAGEQGRAIAAYRRALRVRPDHAPAAQGLEAARALVRTGVAPDASTRVSDAVLFWRGHVGREVVATTGIVAYALFWLGLTIHLTTARAARWPLTALFLLVAVYALSSLAMDHRLATDRTEIVVTAPEVTGRNGPDAAAYEPTFASPLTEGVEGVILERRGLWARVRLGDARVTWIPVGSYEVV
jgi:hypothetical protein